MLTEHRLNEIALLVAQAMNRRQHKRANELHRDHKFAMVDRLNWEIEQERSVMSMDRWSRQGEYLAAIDSVAARMKRDLVTMERLLRDFQKYGTEDLPHPTQAAETLRLVSALCLSGIDTLERADIEASHRMAAE